MIYLSLAPSMTPIGGQNRCGLIRPISLRNNKAPKQRPVKILLLGGGEDLAWVSQEWLRCKSLCGSNGKPQKGFLPIYP